MNNDLLEAFLCVARMKSVSLASEILFLSQSTVTHRIKALEKKLDERLFINKNRKMNLTEAGEALLPYAIEILDIWNQGLEKIRYPSEEPSGELTIGLFHHAALLYGPQLITFIEKYPQIQLCIRTSSPEDSVQLIRDRKLDLAFIRSIRSPGVSFHKMKAGNFLLAVPPNHRLAKRKSIEPQDLNGEDFVFLHNGAADQKIIDQFFQEFAVDSKIKIKTNNFEVCKQFIWSGLGLAFLPQYAIQTELDNGSICGIPVKLSKQYPQHDVDFIWLKENEHLPLFCLMIKHITGRSL